MFEFRHIEYLYTLAGIPVLILLFLLLMRWKKKATLKIGDPPLVKQLMQGYSSKLFTTKFILVILAFGLCAFAVADVVVPEGQEKINRNGIDVMIALDVSKSMLAQDIKPNRIERAKQVITKIIDKLSNDRIGLVIFAGKAYLQMPMTTDHSAAKMYLSAASPDDVPTQGTVISEALKMSYAAFNTKEKKYRTIILITDGEDHDEDAIKVTKELAEQGVMVNTIGIGSPGGAPIMDKETNDYKKDENGNTVITKLNEDELKEIAFNGNGLYQLYSNTEQVAANIQTKLSSLGETTLVDSTFANYKTYFIYFLIASLMLLIAELFISEKRKIRVNKTLLSIPFLLITNAAFTQEINKQIRNGNNAYNKQEYQQATSMYRNALTKDPGNTTATYNLGNSFYKLDKTDEAIHEYDKAIEHTSDIAVKAKTYYNKGVALQKQNKLPECIEAYKNGLKITPRDEEARQNLERALVKLKQQQNKQDKQDQKQKKQQDKKQDEDKTDQKQKDQQQQQPKPQPSKISKQDAEEKLRSLLDHEKDLQDKLHKVRASGIDKPKKDW